MKWLGLVGGTSWHSTAIYYRELNELAQQKLGGVTSAKCILVSLDFEEIVQNQSGGDLTKNAPLVLEAVRGLKAAGAEAIVLCANTMHFYVDDVVATTGLPVIHIAEATAATINAQGLQRVALLGTKFTMELNFFRDKLTAAGIDYVIPNDADRDFIHQTIIEEMGRGIFTDATRARFIEIIEGLGAEGVILGCTEIPMLLKPRDVSIPMFDTTMIHVEAASAFAIK